MKLHLDKYWLQYKNIEYKKQIVAVRYDKNKHLFLKIYSTIDNMHSHF